MKFLVLGIALAINLCNPLRAESLKTHEIDNEIVLETFTRLRTLPYSAVFVPPEGWMMPVVKNLPKSVQFLVIGKGQKEFPPSINLASEKYGGSLQEYLKLVKEINASMGNEFKNLGTLDTYAGAARLCQVDTTNEWGQVRMLHIFLLKEGRVHIMTAASLKEEFASFRNTFLQSMRSLHVNGNAFGMISDSPRRSKLEESCATLKQKWVELRKQTITTSSFSNRDFFQDKTFQTQLWDPFKERFKEEYEDYGKYWQEYVLNNLQDELLALAIPPITQEIIQMQESLVATAQEEEKITELNQTVIPLATKAENEVPCLNSWHEAMWGNIKKATNVKVLNDVVANSERNKEHSL